MTKNPEAKRGKNDEFYFYKNKKLLHDKKKDKYSRTQRKKCFRLTARKTVKDFDMITECPF